MGKKTIRDIDAAGKKVLVRVDFNVPMDSQGHITDDKRIRESLPTIQYLREQNAQIILISHRGRPKGQVVEELRMDQVTQRLSELLGAEVRQAHDAIGASAQAAVQGLQGGEVVMLENIRFHAEEEKNDPVFAEKLSQLGEIFVLDAFGTAHRAHASTVGIASFLPAVAGLLVEKELDIMGKALESPVRPFAAIIGGAKVSDKIAVLENLLQIADVLLIGGGMANTFLKAKGYAVGSSLLEADKVETAALIMEKAKELRKPIYLPDDVVIAEKMEEGIPVRTVAADQIPEGWMVLDIGPNTRKAFADVIHKAKTIIWNGPMGVFELKPFMEGTKAVAKAVAESEGVSIIGGGDSAAAIEKFGYSSEVSHISTGGGASLEFMEGKTLPGVAALLDQ